MATTTNTKMDYSDFVKNLNNSGIRTTHLGGSETNFAQYGNALSDDLKQSILDSFDCEQDYKLQEQIAGLFKNKSVIQSGDFINSLKSMGLNVNVSYEKTSYISDYKAGNTSGAARNGAIAVYTISDGNGGEIKIADANGNGALESEELFMNQILGDVNNEIGQIGNGVVVQGGQGAQGGQAVQGTTESQNVFDNSDDEEKVSQDDYNSKVESYLEKGYSKKLATLRADSELGVNNMIYTGTQTEIDNTEISQDEFNRTVEKYMDEGDSITVAEVKASDKFGTNGLSYTGTKKETEQPELFLGV